jgi:glycosyltransferase involved in cell wall biosynthesis
MEKLDGVVSLASNSPTAKTGYGVQAKHLVDKMSQSGLNTAVLSNYGQEGTIGEYKARGGKVPVYPRGFMRYSEDVLNQWHTIHRSEWPDKKHAIMTLFDVWVYNKAPNIDDIPFISWVPLDHVTLPPDVAQWLVRPNVTPIAMSPFGQRQMAEHGIESTYIPHAVDTSVYKPTETIGGMPGRKFMGVPEDAFLVSFVGANKADGVISRKAMVENLMGFKQFRETHPDAYLYLHTEPSNAFGGFLVPRLLKAIGLDAESVIMPNVQELRLGFDDKYMAGVFTASDVLLGASMGEGFQVPLIEAAACGTRQIASSWTAPMDLASPDSFLVGGQPWWHEAHQSWWQIPSISFGD